MCVWPAPARQILIVFITDAMHSVNRKVSKQVAKAAAFGESQLSSDHPKMDFKGLKPVLG